MDGQVRAMVIGVVLLGCAASSVSIGGAQSLSPEEIVIDNTQAEVTGTWTPSTYQPNYYGTNYLFRRSGTGANRVLWRPTLRSGGAYAVYYRLPNGSPDRAPDALFTVQHAAGLSAISVDQRSVPQGEWKPLGTFVFVTGATGFVELTDRAGGTYVIADAVKFLASSPLTEVVVDNIAATVTGAWSVSTSRPNYYGTNYLFRTSGGTGSNWVRWTPDLAESGRYFVYCRLPDGATNRAPDAAFAVTSVSGTHTAYVDERKSSSGEYVSLGSFNFAAGTSGYVTLSDQATGTYLIADAIKFVRTDHVYTVRTDLPKQTILGLGVEIQADSIGSGNVGLPETISGVPHDLTESEKTRFYTELLNGFRYVRLAMGLYLRGLTPDRQNIIERYPGQMAELREMIQESGIEGASVEYWSPAPYWKSSNSFIGGSLKQFDAAFLSDFGDSVVRDLDYLTDNGIPVKMFSLQNEPKYSYQKTYSYTPYTHQQYYDTFRHVAPRVKAAYPDVVIHNDSQGGQLGMGSALIQANPAVLSYVNAWTWHRIGADSSDQITNRLTFNSNTFGRPVFNTEFEYLSGGTSVHRMVNTAQSIMNWLTFENSPTWFWLHALKPTYNSESEGYGLGLWRPYDDADFTHYPQINQGHFDYIKTNWHALAGFLKYMPWNSVRFHVDEGFMSANHRIMAWRSPAGKLTIALTNRTTAPFKFDIAVLGSVREFNGYRYDSTRANMTIGSAAGAVLSLTVPSYSIEFWVEP
jgi:O-glycosyl hydrolase